MSSPTMQVAFERRGRTCVWRALRPPRTVVPGPAMAAGGDLPHDLYTFVIECELGIEHGFWGCVANGATFATLGRKRTPKGRAVIAAHLAELDEAERRVNDIYFEWRAGRPTPLDAALDAMLARWRRLDDGEELVLTWPRHIAVRARSRPHGRRPSRTTSPP